MSLNTISPPVSISLRSLPPFFWLDRGDWWNPPFLNSSAHPDFSPGCKKTYLHLFGGSPCCVVLLASGGILGPAASDGETRTRRGACFPQGPPPGHVAGAPGGLAAATAGAGAAQGGAGGPACPGDRWRRQVKRLPVMIKKFFGVSKCWISLNICTRPLPLTLFFARFFDGWPWALVFFHSPQIRKSKFEKFEKTPTI